MALNIVLPNGSKFRAIWKNYTFNIQKPIKKIKLFNPTLTYKLSPKHV